MNTQPAVKYVNYQEANKNQKLDEYHDKNTLLEDKDHLLTKLQESQKLLKERRIAEGYLIYLIKDLCNYYLNPEADTIRRIENNLQTFKSKVHKIA